MQANAHWVQFSTSLRWVAHKLADKFCEEMIQVHWNIFSVIIIIIIIIFLGYMQLWPVPCAGLIAASGTNVGGFEGFY